MSDPVQDPASALAGMTRALLATANAQVEAARVLERALITQVPDGERPTQAVRVLESLDQWIAEAEARDAAFTADLNAQRAEIKARLAALQATPTPLGLKAPIKPYREMIKAIDKALKASAKPIEPMRAIRARVAGMATPNTDIAGMSSPSDHS